MLLAVAAAVMFAAPAHADKISDAGDDSWQATCQVLADDMTGGVYNDTAVAVGIGQALAKMYNLTLIEAAYVENYQVANYCPRWMKNLNAVGAHARAEAQPALNLSKA